MKKEINIFTDGGSRGNPGPSAIGVFIQGEDGAEIASFGKRIGNATNNVAEYQAAVAALQWLFENQNSLSASKVNFYLDSNLVCSQINGVFKIKNATLREYLFKIRQLESEIKLDIYYSHIPREENYRADRLVNLALDS